MHNLYTLLSDIKTKPYLMETKYANSLQEKIQSYLAGDIELPEQDDMSQVEPKEETQGGIAIIEINGVICKRMGLPQEFLEFFGLCDLDFVDAQLKAAMADESITAVILNVCSPGGFTSGVQSTANLVAQLAEKKEVVVYSDLLNASAAYWISAKANSIVINVDTEIGSVGVYTQVWDYSKALESEGVKVNLIKAGRWKALGDPTQPLSDEQKQFLQDDVNAQWELFKSEVNTKRDIADEDLQGQTFSGALAVTNGYADAIVNDISEIVSVLQEENKQ